MIQQTTQECALAIEKINCASCVKKIEDKLASLDGVKQASVNFASGHASISYDPRLINPDRMMRELSSIGYPAHLFDPEEEPPVRNWQSIQLILCFVCSFPLVLHMFSLPLPPLWQVLLASLVQVLGGYSFYVGAWQGLRSFSSNMDTLVALGTSAAFGFSLYTVFTHAHYPLYFETSALLISFILLGRWFESRAKTRANSGMRALVQLQPKKARVKIGQTYTEVPADQVPMGAIFAIRPGERIPVDGTVVEGTSLVDESMLTGESLPIVKHSGSSLFAGTVNRDGLLEAKASKVGKETALGAMIRLVEKAQVSKAPIQRVADRVTAVFVPCVLAAALITFLLWAFIGSNMTEGLINAVAVLVIACPCALGLATPTVIMVACGRAAKEGILIKEAAVLETAQNIQVVLLDKTGTVTEGKLTVKQVFLPREFYPLAAALSIHSDHPAALAISSALRISPLPEVKDYSAIAGKGVRGSVHATPYFLGSPAWMKEQKIDTSSFDAAWAKEEGMIVVLATQEKAIGYFLLMDRLRANAQEAVNALHSLNIAVYLLTGDRAPVASFIAKELNVDGFEAEILPAHKADRVNKYKAQKKITAMVGDGINDAPALASSDIGFGIGSGTDVALESSSVILVRPDLDGVVHTILLAKQTFRKIRQNLAFAFGYNILGIPLAALGLLSPLIAGIAMALSSISVVLNALLLQKKPQR